MLKINAYLLGLLDLFESKVDYLMLIDDELSS